jgi:hypothetical protein
MPYALIPYNFFAVSDIWVAYFAGRISARKRDLLLEPHRAALRAARK